MQRLLSMCSMRQGFRFNILLIIIGLVGLSACGGLFQGVVDAIKKEQVVYHPVYKSKHSLRKNSAKISKASIEDLRKHGFVMIGDITVKYTNEACFPLTEPRKCKVVSHNTDPTARLIKDAAKKGGDIIVMQRHNYPTSERTTKNGRCLSSYTTMTPMTTCNQGKCSTLYIPIVHCRVYEQIPGTAYITVSNASIWRQDPDLINMLKYGKDFRAALLSSNIERIRFYIDKGININQPDLEGYYPLVTAVKGASKAVVRLLLSKGADTNVREQGSKKNPLHLATENGYIVIARLLLAKEANVDVRAAGDLTPAHYAARRGYATFIKLLADNGADLDHKDSRGETALMMAVKAGHVSTVAALISARAKLDIRHGRLMFRRRGKTALQMARNAYINMWNPDRKKAYNQIVDLLRAAGAK